MLTCVSNADAVVELEDKLVFVEPYEISEPFSDFFRELFDSRGAADTRAGMNVKYAQTRKSCCPVDRSRSSLTHQEENDNLHEEYSNLFQDVLPDIAFARIALQQEADAINIWIGNQRSVTALHKDQYENVYVQVRGEKHFALLSPVEAPCVNEQLLPRGRYISDEASGQLSIAINESVEQLPVPVWDPDDPTERATRYSKLARPLRVTLKEGDMLYLPAM